MPTAIEVIGLRRWNWSDIYHWILRLGWLQFFGLVIVLYLLINLLFAAAFFAVPGSIANARPGMFRDALFFSVETLATVGYGYMNPASTYGHVVASTEILVGMLVIAMMTGLLFARFSRPVARVMFSRCMVVAPFDGIPTLMLRAANERANLILEASVRLSFMRREKTKEGETFLRIHDLKLERDRTSAFGLSWTIMHRIDRQSPLYGWTPQALADAGASFTAAISGLDETLNDMIQARCEYGMQDVLFDHRFADILFENGMDVRVLDFRRFHDVIPQHEVNR